MAPYYGVFSSSQWTLCRSCPLERILLSVYKNNHLINRWYPDLNRLADYHMMTDWLMHLPMVHGTMQLGIQLAAGRGNLGKINDLHKSSMIRHFSKMRCASNCERFTQAQYGYSDISSLQNCSRESGNKLFVFYDLEALDTSLKWLQQPVIQRLMIMVAKFLQILQFFHEGITDRVIDYRARLQHHEFSKTDERVRRWVDLSMITKVCQSRASRIQDPPHNIQNHSSQNSQK